MTPFLLTIPAHVDHLPLCLSLLAKQESWQKLKTNNHPDVIVANSNKEGLPIKMIRELITELNFAPYQHTQRAFILCHLEQASIPAQNALLKSLEEPPDYAVFILSTSGLDKVLPTIRSRCLVVSGSGDKDLNLDQEQKSSFRFANSHGQQIEAEQFYQTLNSASISQKIDLASQYKDRDVAQEMVSNLIRWLHLQPPSKTAVNQLKLLVQAHDQLSENANVQLVLEACLLRMKK